MPKPWKKTNLRERARKLKTELPALYLALRQPETPLSARLLGALTVAYALSPVDLIPDFIPVLGYLDDLIILPLLIALTVRRIPEEVLIRCRGEAETLWADGGPKKWYYAVPAVLLWLAVLLLIGRAAVKICSTAF